tara:strand:- start:5415 stop:6881 length:1467 start_codon:yes stop_codon:yes gene_type:complete
MSIKKYYANQDNTITNAYQQNLQTRGTEANMGLSDILETFSIYGQASSGSTELERILIEFPVSQIITDRSNGSIPESGKVNFVLNMYNAVNNQTTPRELELVVLPISKMWQEGTGLDMEEYKDVTRGGNGSNWINASSGTAWANIGGDYLSSPAYSQIFPVGDEDLEIDITPLVEQWIAGGIANYGVGIHLTSSQEAYWPNPTGEQSQINNLLGSQKTWYTKKFFGRGSEFFFKRPTIEAVWDSSIKDDRGNFYASSSLLPAAENDRTIYLYNAIGGRLRDIPGITTLSLKMYTSASGGELITSPAITGGKVSTGIYSASFALDTSASVVYDRWSNPGFTACYYTGSIDIKTHNASGYSPYPNLVTNLTNLRSIYYPHETTRFRFYVREKDWSPTIYTVAASKTDTLVIESGSYQIHRLTDNLVAIPYITGSSKGTEMSFDVSGNYFDLQISLLEPGYSYGIKIAYYDETVNSYVEQPHIWKFRVEEV